MCLQGEWIKNVTVYFSNGYHLVGIHYLGYDARQSVIANLKLQKKKKHRWFEVVFFSVPETW